MKHVPRQSAAAVVVAGAAAGMAADAAVVAAVVGVAATVAVAGAAAIAATVEIAGKKSSESESVAPQLRSGRLNPSQRILSGISASIIHRCGSHLRRFNSSNPVER